MYVAACYVAAGKWQAPARGMPIWMLPTSSTFYVDLLIAISAFHMAMPAFHVAIEDEMWRV